MKIRPAHHALLCYAEWCCDNRRPWPGMKRVAADLARNKSDLEAAFSELRHVGLLSCRYHGNGQALVIRLGDGRETAPMPIRVVHKKVPHDILVIHKDDARRAERRIAASKTRIAA